MASDTTQKLVSFIHAVFIYLLPLFSFISAYISRLKTAGRYLKKKDDDDENIEFVEAEYKAVNDGFRDCGGDNKDDNNINSCNFVVEEEEDKKTEMYLTFKFPTLEEFTRTGNNTALNTQVVPCFNNSKYDFTSGKSFIGTFRDEPESFPVKEINDDECDAAFKSLEHDEDSFLDGCANEKGKEVIMAMLAEDRLEKTECSEVEGESEFQGNQEECVFDQSHNFPDIISMIGDSEIESTSSENLNSVAKGLMMNSYCDDGFLSNGDFGGQESGINDLNDHSGSELSLVEENQDLSSDDFDDEEDDYIIKELENLEQQNLHTKPDFLSEEDFGEDLLEDLKISENTEENNSVMEVASVSDSVDSNKLESLWEHQELIDQLKSELKKVRATGLPTILEESESPKIMEDLKPWRIEEKFHHYKDHIGELHKFYKSYKERMRKFDILSYQKMYAMGFLQLKDPLQSISSTKASVSTVKSVVSQNLWLSKRKIHDKDPMTKFIIELQGDLEVVYVGHMCLSWEILHWQYEKALELWDSDPRGTRQYNEVAGEFQQFQVLMQRFIEDEPFQGPRVQNYVKSRCALRNLLQVPVIREDNSGDKRKAWKKDIDDEYVLTSDVLVEILEESIRIFWRFVRADKECHVATINGHKRTPELPSQEDLSLLSEVKKDLVKKEKKLKEILRSESCILRKFSRRKNKDDNDESDQVLYFFSQVDMRLVARVLNMSKITRDQLIWCHNKLSRISFVNRKIHVEPGFLLFPC